MPDRPGYVTVRVSMLPDPIEVPLDEVPVLRSQGLLVEEAPPSATVTASDPATARKAAQS